MRRLALDIHTACVSASIIVLSRSFPPTRQYQLLGLTIIAVDEPSFGDMRLTVVAIEALSRPDFIVEVSASLAVRVAVWTAGVETWVVATCDVRVAEFAGAGCAVRAVGAVAAGGCVWVFEGTAGVGAVGVEFAFYGGGEVLAALGGTGMRGGAFVVLAGGAVRAFVC